MSTIIDSIREQFPALKQNVYGKHLVYFDNAATSQRLQSALELQTEVNLWANANVHRAVHFLSSKATEFYEKSRETVVKFLNAEGRENIIFTSGTTAAINIVANGFSQRFLTAGDKVLISEAEHHSNIVSWQIACEKVGAELKVIPIETNGLLSPEKVDSMIDDKVKIVSIAHVANVVGIENPIKEIISIAHKKGVPVLIDGAQGIVHTKVDVRDLGCDFYVFSAHKIYAPTGVGVLYGKKELLEQIPPMIGGGDMVETVSFDKTTYASLPLKFEAGTPNFASVAALSPALLFAMQLCDSEEVQNHESTLLKKMENVLRGVDGLKLVGGYSDEVNNCRVPVFSFSIEGIHPEDAAQILDKMGVAVRSGLMCAEPIVRKYSSTGLLRVSLLPYNTEKEIEIFEEALHKTVKMLK